MESTFSDLLLYTSGAQSDPSSMSAAGEDSIEDVGLASFSDLLLYAAEDDSNHDTEPTSFPDLLLEAGDDSEPVTGASSEGTPLISLSDLLLYTTGDELDPFSLIEAVGGDAHEESACTVLSSLPDLLLYTAGDETDPLSPPAATVGDTHEESVLSTVPNGFSVALGRVDAAAYLANFVKDLIESGFVGRSITKHQIKGLKAV